MDLTAITDEATRWAVHEQRARAAFGFWQNFLILRCGDSHAKELGAEETRRWLLLIRAVSFVESVHGTGSGNEPARDPVQCGNPRDTWWKELNGSTQTEDRFVTGPGGKNYDASELPAAAAEGGLPQAARLDQLGDKSKGHNDSRFSADTSFYWGIPYLIHRTNITAGRKTYQCGACSRADLLEGAKAYNGGGNPEYKNLIDRALTQIGWPA